MAPNILAVKTIADTIQAITLFSGRKDFVRFVITADTIMPAKYAILPYSNFPKMFELFDDI